MSRKLNAAVCRSCGASVVWGRTPAGKAIPLDAEPVDGGNLGIRDDGTVVSSHGFPAGAALYVTHFATCPNAGQHRKTTKGRETPDG